MSEAICRRYLIEIWSAQCIVRRIKKSTCNLRDTSILYNIAIIFFLHARKLQNLKAIRNIFLMEVLRPTWAIEAQKGDYSVLCRFTIQSVYSRHYETGNSFCLFASGSQLTEYYIQLLS